MPLVILGPSLDNVERFCFTDAVPRRKCPSIRGAITVISWPRGIRVFDPKITRYVSTYDRNYVLAWLPKLQDVVGKRRSVPCPVALQLAHRERLRVSADGLRLLVFVDRDASVEHPSCRDICANHVT